MPDVLPLRRPDPAPPAAEPARPLAVDAKRLAALLCCGVRTVRTWDAAGKLPAPCRISGRVLWKLDEIRAWLDAGAPDRDQWAAIRDARR